MILKIGDIVEYKQNKEIKRVITEVRKTGVHVVICRIAE